MAQDQQSTPKYSLLGHVGHLTHEQEVVLQEFKSRLQAAGLYIPGDESGSKKPSHTDATLLRFLRARQFNAAKAVKQFSDREAWAKQMNLDSLYHSYDVDEFTSAQCWYPMWIGRTDRMGYPIHVFRLASLDAKRIQSINKVPLEKRYETITVLHELLIRGTAPLCSTLPSLSYPTPVDGTTTIVDLEGVSFSLMWNLRTHLQQASVLANANFPETMGMTWIVNAPSFFSTVWGWLKVWFDENTRRKIHVLSHSQLHLLRVEIPAENLPKRYGGDLNWEFDERPKLDDRAKDIMKDFNGEVPRGPWELRDGKVVLGKDLANQKREQTLVEVNGGEKA
ncbi:hypothetical protein FRB90_009609 [Tulasnella sp. 427]|nr:hypothetical protein FRB90_009609 [Tulasnella sp. 427]